MRGQLTRKEKVLQVIIVAAGIVIVFLLVAIWLGTQIGD
jgi:cell division protein FtsL